MLNLHGDTTSWLNNRESTGEDVNAAVGGICTLTRLGPSALREKQTKTYSDLRGYSTNYVIPHLGKVTAPTMKRRQ